MQKDTESKNSQLVPLKPNFIFLKKTCLVVQIVGF